MTVWDDLMQNFRKDGTKDWHKGKIISSIVFVLILFLIGLWGHERSKENAADRKANKRYAIGTTGKQYHNIKSSQPTMKYYYQVGSQEDSGFESIPAQLENSVVANGGKYFVEFSSENPSNSKLLLDYPVPDTVKNTAVYGWTYMPGYNDKR